MIYEVKQDGCHKAHLVVGGHLVDPRGISTRSTVVKGVSVHLLDVIAHCDNQKVFCGDVGNAFITAPPPPHPMSGKGLFQGSSRIW